MSGGQGVVDVYIAGVRDGDRGPAGWGAVLRYGTAIRELKGSEPAPGSPDELLSTAATAALAALTRPARVRLHAEPAVLRSASTGPHRVVCAGVQEDGPDQARAVALAREELDEAVRDRDARCLHDLVRNQCWQCRPRSGNLPDRVKVTSGGSVFHLSEGCAALHDGWRQLERRGGIRSDLTSIPTVDALARGLGACEDCCRGLLRG
jgi:ribonuclease HI